MKRIKTFIAAALLGLFVLTPALPVAAAPFYVADAKQDVCQSLNAGADCGKSTGPSVNNIIRTGINLLSLIAGVIAIVMIIIAGLKYIISSGDPKNIESSKNTLLYAIVGLVVVAFAQLIVRFVLSTAS